MCALANYNYNEYPQSFVYVYICIMRLCNDMHAEKNKGADQPVHCTADFRFCFSLNQTTGFTGFLTTDLYNASYIKNV